MVLTITVVGNGQGGSNGAGHAVLSPNELAQLMSGQTVTGLLNPDGSITLNSNVMSSQQLASLPQSIQNGMPSSINNSTGANYQTSRLQVEQQMSTPPANSITNIQAITSDSNPSAANNHSQNASTQKKTGQKRLTAKQKLAQKLQQQQQPSNQQQQQKVNQQMQSPDARLLMTAQSDQSMGHQQPQIVATVQLPNGQIGQLIAPSGGQFWSPNAINLQQLSMAVAAATGTMPQTMSIPAGSSSQTGQQLDGSNVQQQQQMQSSDQGTQQDIQQQQQQQQPQPQQPSQSLNNPSQQQVMTTMQLPNNQLGQVMGRQGQNQIWSGGPISLSQLQALAQQGMVQLSPMQGIPTSGPNGQRVIEMMPQAAIQGLLSQNGQPMQAMALSNGGQYIAQDPNDHNKWQIVPSAQMAGNQQSSMQTASSAHSSGHNDTSTMVMARNSGGGSGGGGGSFSHFVNSSSHNTVVGDAAQQPPPQPAGQPQRKLKRLACTCPNCRDGDNSRSSGDKKKQHICHFPDCNKVYGKTSHLRAHLRWHSGERPYVCSWSFCGKKFTRSDELQRHRRTHTGEKRFQCSECLKRFMRSDHLSKHLKTHLSSKKSGSSQPQANGLPTLVTLPQNPIKMEENMIDELTLERLDGSNKSA